MDRLAIVYDERGLVANGTVLYRSRTLPRLHYWNVLDTAGVNHCIRPYRNSPASKLIDDGCKSSRLSTVGVHLLIAPGQTRASPPRGSAMYRVRSSQRASGCSLRICTHPYPGFVVPRRLSSVPPTSYVSDLEEHTFVDRPWLAFVVN